MTSIKASPTSPTRWHVLTEASVPVAEFALALSRRSNVISWLPEMSLLGTFQTGKRRETRTGSSAHERIHFALQRGYSRWSFAPLRREYGKVFHLLCSESEDPEQEALICTSSFWAPVAERWPGPVVYYATDFTMGYEGLIPSLVLAADRAMCAVADLTCANSTRLAAHFRRECEFPEDRLIVLPNATRAANLLLEPSAGPASLPDDLPPLRRPIAGVIGNLAGNLDWALLEQAVQHTPEYTWLFVGPTSMNIVDRAEREARARVMQAPQTCFAGPRNYADLYRYARAIDLAVMPYRAAEPTYSGSATRFYEHLAAGRPILSTRGVEELLHKEPLLKLVDGWAELAREMLRLQRHSSDGQEQARWKASQSETWEARVDCMIEALAARTAVLSHLAGSKLQEVASVSV